MTRKFLTPETFERHGSDYHLLPFRFHRIDQSREVLVNEVGDYLVCPRGTATRLAERQITKSDPLYIDLISNFFISPTPIPELIDILATRYRTKKSFLDSFTALHIFVVTLRCNQSCPYCQVSRQTADKSRYDMSIESIDRAIDLMMQTPAREITMEFQGGEPLLAFDGIRHATERALSQARENEKRISFVVCTNLTMLEESMLDFFHRHSFLISTSLDGPQEIHDRNRPMSNASSYDEAVKNITRARTALGGDRIAALMTTTRLSLAQPEAIVDSYVAHGFDHIFLRPVSPFGFATRSSRLHNYSVSEYLAFYRRALRHILRLNESGTEIVEDYAALILKKILTPFPIGFVDLQSPAGLINSVVVYNYDGGVFASDESRMLAETGDQRFKLGNVTDSYGHLFHGAKAQEIAQYWSNESLAGCSDCGFQAYCGADPVLNHATQKDCYGHRPSSMFCERNMEIIRWLFELMDSDPKVEQIFRRWAAQG